MDAHYWLGRLFVASLFVFVVTLTEISTTKLTYEWYANLTAGSLLPKDHLSRYQIKAQLAVYVTNKTHYAFQIENITATGTNIIDKDEIHLPFRVVYSDEVHIYADEHDQNGSLNMKKSLAGFFILKQNGGEEGAAIVTEDNTYGTCKVEYITRKKESKVIVTKLIDESSCGNSPYKRNTNTPLFLCPSSYQDGVANQNEKKYTFLNRHNPYISEITSISSVHFQPFQALAEAHYVHVSQLLKLMSIEEGIEPPASNNSIRKDILFNTATVVYDPTSGRLPSNKPSLKEEIHQALENLAESLDWKLSTNNLDNQTSFHILELMWFLDVADWEDLYKNISLGTSYTEETIQHLFNEFLPQVGSEASINFIKYLVKTKKVKGFSASLLLITFPLHVKKGSEEFLVQSEEFLRLDVEPEVRNTGILSFAVLVQNICNTSCTKELLDRYTKYFLDKFSDSSNYGEQMIYLQALSNMQNSRTFDYLSPIIANPSYDRHIRHLAIGCIMRTLEKHEEKAVELFWPIFVNTSEPLEIRVSAMNALITTRTSSARLLTFFWHMQTETNYHLHNFFYTTVQSYANTKYPCYNKLRHIASQLSRYIFPRAYRWATGNYILDYEDSVRGYGGLIKSLIIASEVTGLPSYIFLATEQHSHGLSSRFSIQLKLEGVADPTWKTLFEKGGNSNSFFQPEKLAEFLLKNNLKVSIPEEVHVEVIIKIDNNAVHCRYFNSSSFYGILQTINDNMALYYEFSINYQRLRFPIRYELTKITELGTPVALQILTSSILSLRGSIKQADKGKIRNADLDFRYSMNTVTSLKTLNIFNQKWYGADRLRSLHFRLPFSVKLMEDTPKSSFRITINRRNKDFNGSALGFVWHSTIKLFPPSEKQESFQVTNGNNSSPWSIESRDLGARFNANVFDCQGENNALESLFIIKEAFQLSNKNYKMMIGGVPILGLYSLANYFTFIPPGDSCGIILSMMPLQVQLTFVREGWTFQLTLENETDLSLIWNLRMLYKDFNKEGQKTIDFRLEHANSEKEPENTLGLIQLEGSFAVPSFKQGILKAPGTSKGQAKIAWGSKLQNTSIELELRSDNRNENWPSNCDNDSVNCLQTVSNLATVQTVFLNCNNLPIWATTALLSIFPENVQADKTSTRVQFTLPAKLPWTTQGECVVNSDRVLKFDNGTIQEFVQSSACYSLAVADCSPNSQFIVGLKKIAAEKNVLEIRVKLNQSELIIRPDKTDDDFKLLINQTFVNLTTAYQFYPPGSNITYFTYQFKYWDTSKMIEVVVGKSGLILQYYGQSVVAIAEYKLRGKTCGLCGDFNGEISNDDVNFTSCIEDFVL